MSTELDQYLSRFQNLPTFNIYSVAPDGLTVEPWYEVGGDALISELVIDELNLHEAVATITAQIQKWGRLAAQARRVWEIEERKLRSWKAKFYLAMVKAAAQAGEKKPTEGYITSSYQADPEYDRMYAAIERAEEACNSAEAVLSAYRAKKDMLQKFVRRSMDSGAATLAV